MSDLDRLRKAYESRKMRLSGDDRYSTNNPTYLFMLQQRQKALRALLEQHGMNVLSGNCILEIGCGSGGVLAEFQELGAEPTSLFGIDLLFDRLQEAHCQLPSSNILNADGQFLPFPRNSFDIVLQYTAFSSVLDDRIKQKMAGDMLRVLRPNGTIIWYDFWWNPINLQTRGIKPKEIKKLFPDCRFQFRRITLAPPIARMVVPCFREFGLLLESLRIFTSHYFVVIQKILKYETHK